VGGPTCAVAAAATEPLAPAPAVGAVASMLGRWQACAGSPRVLWAEAWEASRGGEAGGRQLEAGRGRRRRRRTPGANLEFGSLARRRALFIGLAKFHRYTTEFGNAIECPRMV
jgi:hypothetical protein